MPSLLVVKNRKSPALTWLFGVLLLGAASFLVWNVFYAPSGVSKHTVLEVPENASVAVRLMESPNFIENSGVQELLEGESVQTREGQATLVFFENTRVTLDEHSEVMLETVRENEDDRSENIHLVLTKGRIWASVPRKINPKSQVVLEDDPVSVEIHGGEVSFEKYRIAVAKGNAELFIGDSLAEDLGVGQEILLTEQDIQQAASGELTVEKSLLSADFQSSEWFVAHMSPDTSVPTEDTSLTQENADGMEDSSLTPSPFGPEPPAIQITSPGKNGEIVPISESAVVISGTVPEGTEKVLVNDYALSKFALGDREFSYNAAVQWGTLQEGKNEYTIVTIGSDGERNEAKITLVYGDSAIAELREETPSEEEAGNTESSEESSSTVDSEKDTVLSGQQDLTIDSPKTGAESDEDPLDVFGKAPSGAAKIVVDDYTLSKFSLGNTTWSYRMSNAFGNRPEGEKTIHVEAFDSDGNKIASKTVTFTILPAKKASASQTSSVTETTSTSEEKKNWANIREGTLPPAPQEGNEPSI